MPKEKYSVGLGFDVHRFSKKKKDLVLAGVHIPDAPGLEAVSDGDVVLHAVADAVCGACGLGDIGDYFPPSSAKSQGISSAEIVEAVVRRIEKQFTVTHIDVVIVADTPRLITYKKKMNTALKKIFSLAGINIKIKSKEGLDIL